MINSDDLIAILEIDLSRFKKKMNELADGLAELLKPEDISIRVVDIKQAQRTLTTALMQNLNCRHCGRSWETGWQDACWAEKDLCVWCFAELQLHWWGRLRLWFHRKRNPSSRG